METQTVGLMEARVQAKSKSELYRALTVSNRLYLITQKECRMTLINEIRYGRKR